MSHDAAHERIKELEQALEQAQNQAKSLGNLLEKKLNELYTHYHIARTIGSLLDIPEMLRQVAGILKKTIPFERLSLYLVDDNKRELELLFFTGLNIDHQVRLQVGDGTPGRIVESGEHAHIHDLALFYDTFNDFIHFPGEEKRDGCYIGISLKVHNAVIGILGMDSPRKYGLGVDDLDFMAVLSHQIAAGIERARLFEKIKQLSQLDGLTGLYNHRMFQERLQQEMSRINRTQKPLSLVMLDIDHFKRINDTFGHQEGDIALKELAEIITRQTRCASIDVCCRYGGEEFTVIMPELPIHNAVKAAERLRQAVERHRFRFTEKEPGAALTVSIGVAGITGDQDVSAEEFVKKADEALYLSKNGGRNRVSYSPVEGK